MDGWSYFTLVLKNPDISTMDARLNALGADGWELVTALSTIKTWVNLSGNDLVLLFQKPGAGLTPSPEAQAVATQSEGMNAW